MKDGLTKDLLAGRVKLTETSSNKKDEVLFQISSLVGPYKKVTKQIDFLGSACKEYLRLTKLIDSNISKLDNESKENIKHEIATFNKSKELIQNVEATVEKF